MFCWAYVLHHLVSGPSGLRNPSQEDHNILGPISRPRTYGKPPFASPHSEGPEYADVEYVPAPPNYPLRNPEYHGIDQKARNRVTLGGAGIESPNQEA